MKLHWWLRKGLLEISSELQVLMLMSARMLATSVLLGNGVVQMVGQSWVAGVTLGDLSLALIEASSVGLDG